MARWPDFCVNASVVNWLAHAEICRVTKQRCLPACRRDYEPIAADGTIQKSYNPRLLLPSHASDDFMVSMWDNVSNMARFRHSLSSWLIITP